MHACVSNFSSQGLEGHAVQRDVLQVVSMQGSMTDVCLRCVREYDSAG